jgi:hypothetical protein
MDWSERYGNTCQMKRICRFFLGWLSVDVVVHRRTSELLNTSAVLQFMQVCHAVEYCVFTSAQTGVGVASGARLVESAWRARPRP